MASAPDPASPAARLVATRIVRRLRDAGHVAYFAGGCVRDALLGRSPTDFDVATDATPARVRSLFPRTAEVGAAFGVVLVHEHESAGGGSVEVATFRSDGPYSDARRPDTVRFSDPESDARRRDFTINALFLDPLDSSPASDPDAGGRVIDYVGGLADLRGRVVRAVGDPDQRLAEDHLRALRAVRFTARLGFRLDPATAAAVTRHAAALRGVSRERIGEELRRMLPPASRAAAVELLQRLGLDSPVLGEVHSEAVPRLLAGLGGEPVPVPLALAAWMLDRHAATGFLAEPEGRSLIGAWRGALCLSNQETEDLGHVLRGFAAVLGRWSTGTLRVAQRKRIAAPAWFPDVLRLVDVRDPRLAEHVRKEVGAMLGDGVGIWPRPLVTGDDLIEAGLKAGPAFRRILDEVLDAQLEGKVRSKDQGLELARRLNV